MTRKQREFQQREEEIIQTATKLFSESGSEKVTIDMIAQAIDIAKGTVYKHFRSKDEILAAICIRFLQRLNERLRSNDKSQPFDKQMRFMGRCYLEFCIRHADEYRLFLDLRERLLLDNLGPEMKSALLNCYYDQKNMIVEAIEGGIKSGALPAGNPNHLFLIGFGLMDGALRNLIRSTIFDIEIEDKDTYIAVAQDVLNRAILSTNKL